MSRARRCGGESGGSCKYLQDMLSFDTETLVWHGVAQRSTDDWGLPEGRHGAVCAYQPDLRGAEVLVVWGGQGLWKEQQGSWLNVRST